MLPWLLMVPLKLLRVPSLLMVPALVNVAPTTRSPSPEVIVIDPVSSTVKSIPRLTSEVTALLPSMIISSKPVGRVSPLQFAGSDQLLPSPPPSQVTVAAAACWTGNDRNGANTP